MEAKVLHFYYSIAISAIMMLLMVDGKSLKSKLFLFWDDQFTMYVQQKAEDILTFWKLVSYNGDIDVESPFHF